MRITVEFNKVLVYVTKHTGFDFSGYFYTPLQEPAVPFASFADLVFLLEQQFEEIQLPQAAFQRRSFIPEEQKSPPQPLTEAETYFTEHPRGEKIPVLACFSVHVLYRQYGSWQGRAVWEDAHKIANFRSAIELLYLINSALETPMGRKKAKQNTTMQVSKTKSK